MHFEQLHTARLVLRRFESNDLEPFLDYRNDPDVARYQSWEYVTAEQARALIAEQRGIEPGQPGSGFEFAVTRAESGELIGDCYFTLLCDDSRQGEVGYTFSASAQGQGYATEAIAAVLRYAFGSLGLHRMIARTACANTRSIALLERLGLRREGWLRRSYWCKGEWVDEYLYAVLRDEYPI